MLNQKRYWTWLLFGLTIVAFVAVLYYSGVLLKDIAKEERNKVELWAKAVKHKAELVNSTNKFFNEIKLEEGKRAQQFAQVFQKLNEASTSAEINSYLSEIENNKKNNKFPLILASSDGSISYTMNEKEEVEKMRNVSQLGDRLAEYDSIVLHYDPEDTSSYVTIFYKQSQVYTDLKGALDTLQSSFFQEIVSNTASLPVLVTNATMDKVILSGNIDTTELQANGGLAAMLDHMKNKNQPIEVVLPDQGKCYVFYEESPVLVRLRYFPYIQLFIILVFVIIAYLLFSFARRSEQNRVWVGMSKETAHQLGTPISSLMAWTEILRESEVDPTMVDEINKDVKRLDTIAQRFSKIGSVPELKEENLVEVIRDFTAYLRTRISSKVTITFDADNTPDIIIPLNRYLFEWVIENLCKNAVDAMDGCGSITIVVADEPRHVHIDITDTGKGIPQKMQKTIFNPGYTSKSRGWGLGLTLAKRIIKEYHKGKLFVKNSVVGKGTTMRITLKKQKAKSAVSK